MMNLFFLGLFDIDGLFGWGHLFFSLTGFIVLIILLILSRNFKMDKVDKIIKYTFYLTLIAEVIKIYVRSCVLHGSLNSWVPLYFCSLYIYFSGLYTYGKGIIKRVSLMVLIYGTTVGGFMFLIYPSTVLLYNPVISVASFHSWIYHIILSYVGLVIIFNNLYELKLKDFLYYTIPILIIELFVYLFNLHFGTNMMLIQHHGTVPLLKVLYRIVGKFYPLAVSIGQAISTFVISYLIFFLIGLRKQKKNNIDNIVVETNRGLNENNI